MGERIDAIQRRCRERTVDAYLASFAGLGTPELVEAGGLFEAALASLQAAATRGMGWSLVVDADIRLYHGITDLLQDVVEDVPADVYQVRFACDDKLLGIPIFGVHLHRNRLAGQAAEWFRTRGVPGLRAESSNLQAFLASSGLQTLTVKMVVGSHDFGQFFRDLAAKYFIRGLRYRHRLTEMTALLRAAARDADATVALAAVELSRAHTGTTSPDRDAFDGCAVVRSLGLTEKGPMQSPREEDDIGSLRPLRGPTFP